jgi:uracil-DNA glycosylase
LMDRHDICLLTGQPCDGVALKPTNESILNCLTFLLEEIGVLHPPRVILMGARVTEFVLKAFGLQDPTFDEPVYKLGESLFIPSSAEYELGASELEALAAASQQVLDR